MEFHIGMFFIDSDLPFVLTTIKRLLRDTEITGGIFQGLWAIDWKLQRFEILIYPSIRPNILMVRESLPVRVSYKQKYTFPQHKT